LEQIIDQAMPEIRRQVLIKARGTVNAYGRYGASRG
jgi:hypothetical protein